MSCNASIPADILVVRQRVLRSEGGIIVRVAVLKQRKREAGPAGPLTIPVDVFCGFLAACPLEPRPPVVLATPDKHLSRDCSF